MGPLSGVMGMIPGMPKEMKDAQIGDDQVTVTEAIIRSMTPDERARPEMINGSRRSRIALGSGTQVADVNRLVKQFSEMQKMMKKMGAMSQSRGGKPSKKKGKGKGKDSSSSPKATMRQLSDMLGGGGLPGVPGNSGQGGFPNFPNFPN